MVLYTAWLESAGVEQEAMTAPNAASRCARAGCGHGQRAHDKVGDRCRDCTCEGYMEAKAQCNLCGGPHRRFTSEVTYDCISHLAAQMRSTMQNVADHEQTIGDLQKCVVCLWCEGTGKRNGGVCDACHGETPRLEKLFGHPSPPPVEKPKRMFNATYGGEHDRQPDCGEHGCSPVDQTAPVQQSVSVDDWNEPCRHPVSTQSTDGPRICNRCGKELQRIPDQPAPEKASECGHVDQIECDIKHPVLGDVRCVRLVDRLELCGERESSYLHAPEATNFSHPFTPPASSAREASEKTERCACDHPLNSHDNRFRCYGVVSVPNGQRACSCSIFTPPPAPATDEAGKNTGWMHYTGGGSWHKCSTWPQSCALLAYRHVEVTFHSDAHLYDSPAEARQEPPAQADAGEGKSCKPGCTTGIDWAFHVSGCPNPSRRGIVFSGPAETREETVLEHSDDNGAFWHFNHAPCGKWCTGSRWLHRRVIVLRPSPDAERRGGGR